MTTRSERIRQRQIAYRLLDRLESLSFVPAVKWLKALRFGLWVSAGVVYGAGMRFDTLLCLLVVLIVEIALFHLQLIDVLKDKAE